MKRKTYKNKNYELHKKQRKTWPISPVQKVVPRKSKDVGSNKEIRQAIEDYSGMNDDY